MFVGLLFGNLALTAQTIPYEWVRQMGSVGEEEITGLAVDRDGNCFVTGNYGGNGEFLTLDFGITNFASLGAVNNFIAKYDTNGVLLWARSFGTFSSLTSGNPASSSADVAIGANGHVFVTGSFRGTNCFGTNSLVSDRTDMFIAAYDAGGNLDWVRRFGGGAEERASRIAVDNAGALYVGGYFAGGPPFSSPVANIGGILLTNARGGDDVFLAKFDAFGNVIWAQRAGGDKKDSIFALQVDGAGNPYLLGGFESTLIRFGEFALEKVELQQTVYLTKFDSEGRVLWAQRPFGSGNQGAPNDIAVDRLGNVHMIGVFGEAFGGSVTIDGIFLGGQGFPQRAFVAKLGPDGHGIWAKAGGGSLFDAPVSVAVDENGNGYIAGGYQGTWSFGSHTLPDLGDPFYVFKVSSDGEIAWAYGAGSTTNDAFSSAIAVDAGGNAYVSGSFSRNLFLGQTNLAASGQHDIFLFKGPRPPPAIYAQPQSRTVAVGETVTFSVAAVGEPPLTYQWVFNGTPLGGATNATLTLGKTTHAHAGFYSVVVSNQAGSVTSTTVQLLFTFLTLNFYAGLTIDGEVGQNFQVQFVPEFGGSTSWQTLTNVTLTTAPYLFIDPESPRVRRRIYRAIPIQP